MIPLWKVLRELNRIKDKTLALPGTLAALPQRLSEPRRREIYLRDFETLTRRSFGVVPAGERIAVLLLFQPKGVAPSVFLTLDWLRSAGYAPLVVSNAPVRDGDRERLLQSAWSLLERPNFGYDFGGYQDAIRLINRDGLSPDRLVVMNDSVWCPLRRDLFDVLETNWPETDIVGLLQDEKVQHDTSGGTLTAKSHIESYFYLIRSSAWRHEAFQDFWRTYQMSDYKPNTIKFGEIGFSRRMMAEGVTMEAYSRRSIFLEQLSGKDDAFIARTLRYAAYGDRDIARRAARLARLPMSSPGWRAAALDHIRRAVNRRRFTGSFPYANDQIFGTAFLKKSSEAVYLNMRRAYLRAVEDGEIAAPDPVLLAEIRAATPS
ncbi:MAG: rhamnan synthesis F family protein [Tabrizicola sp.]